MRNTNTIHDDIATLRHGWDSDRVAAADRVEAEIARLRDETAESKSGLVTRLTQRAEAAGAEIARLRYVLRKAERLLTRSYPDRGRWDVACERWLAEARALLGDQDGAVRCPTPDSMGRDCGRCPSCRQKYASLREDGAADRDDLVSEGLNSGGAVSANAIERLRIFVRSYGHAVEGEAARVRGMDALAAVEALLEAAKAVVRNGARMPPTDPPIVPDEISDLAAAVRRVESGQ